MTVVVIENAADPVVSLEEVKAHLREESSDNDADILSKIWGAITEFEDPNLGWLGRSITPRNIELRRGDFCDSIRLPVSPILSGDDYPLTVKYDDEDGAEQTLADTVYRLVDPEGSNARVVLKTNQSWPDVISDLNAVRIRYWAGYYADDVRINNFKSAVKLHVQMTYDGDTEAAQVLTETINRLLQPYRVYR